MLTAKSINIHWKINYLLKSLHLSDTELENKAIKNRFLPLKSAQTIKKLS